MAEQIKKQIVNELHRPARVHFRRRQYKIKGINDLWEIDLMELRQFKDSNNGYQYVLIVIDVFSKFVFAEILKNKTGIEVTRAMKKILDRGGKPNLLQSDRGSEFYNRKFKKLMDENRIHHYSTFTKIKCAHAERVIRTLKGMLFKNLHYRGSYKYINVVQSIVTEYNQRKHRTIKIAPAEVNKNNERFILENIYKNLQPFDSIRRHKREVLKEGDVVRISTERGVFDKGYLPNWSTEIFRITDVKNTNPVTYYLEDMEGQPISGGFYSEELMKTVNNNIYLVEKILKSKNNKLLVKWLGFETASWIQKKDILQ